PGETVDNPMLGSVGGLLRFHGTGLEEPLSIHSDHYATNSAYGTGAYTKGSVLLEQLKYIMGERNFNRGLKNYYHTWQFKHPNINDFIRVMEKSSGLELDWFKEYFVYTTHYPDYAIGDVRANADWTDIKLQKNGRMPMPLDVVITYKDGTKTLVNIPIRIMRGEKPKTASNMQYILGEDWPWTNPEYTLTLKQSIDSIEKVEIDPSGSMLDLNRADNVWKKKGPE
ncbi:MAG: aminopeptidase N, partial [Saprospiraceae bacterium]